MVKNRILIFFCFCQLDEQTDKVIQGGPFSPQKRECQNLRLQQLTIQKLSFVGKELCDITIYHMKQMISLWFWNTLNLEKVLEILYDVGVLKHGQDLDLVKGCLQYMIDFH